MSQLALVIQVPSVARIAVTLTLALAGCATPVLQPTVDVPGRYASAQPATTEPEIAWWESFGDPVLSDLVRRAARENRDVKMAAERVRAARASETISRSSLFPSVGVSASGSDYRTGYDAATRQSVPAAANAKSATASVDVSWEVDLSGRLRAGAAAAAADTLAAAHSERGVRLLVMTDVATNYFTLVGALRQLETLRAIAAAHDETLRLVTARQRAGLATAFDVERAQITDEYFSKNRTLEEFRHLAHSDEADPLKDFGAVCRAEINSMRAKV